MKIAVISPYTRFEEKLRRIGAEFPDVSLHFFQASFEMDKYVEKAIKHVSEIEREGYDAIIARGVVYLAIYNKTNIPVIYAGETLYDTIDALHKLKKNKNYERKVYLFVLEGNLIFNEEFAKMLNIIFNVDLSILTYSTLEECEKILSTKIENDSVVIGGRFITAQCKKYGIEHVLSESGYNTLKTALLGAINIVKIRRSEIFEKDKMKAILDFAQEGIAYVNLDMKIEMMNPAARKIWDIEEHWEQGKKELEACELRALCNVAIETKEACIEEIVTLNSNIKFMCNVIPIIANGEVKSLAVTFREIVQVIQMESKIRREFTKKMPGAKYYAKDIIGDSERIKNCKKLIKQFGKFDSNVLIYGHTGTGKELFAQAIHNESNRKNNLFLALNCAALPEQLLESELFGYIEGAFTGAKKGGKPGLFELAHGGTLYLDEISEMSISSQSKLLRVLQEGEIRRVGDDKVQPVNVRVIASSQENLHTLIQNHKFREDLFYRLNVMSLTIPTLNSRREDIVPLVEHFMVFYGEKFNVDRRIKFEADAIEFLKNYNWRGNVRQLQNFIERVYVYDLSGNITLPMVQELLKDFDMLEYTEIEKSAQDMHYPVNHGNLRKITSEIVKETLEMFEGNQTKAARYLGVSRTYIWRQLKEKQHN